MKVHVVSLGCARNLVDSEVMLGHLAKADWKIVNEPETADVIIINTCSFIASAVDESIDTVLEMARYKKEGNCSTLVVAGCLPERFKEDIAPEMPEVDLFLGTGAFDKVAEEIDRIAMSKVGPVCLFPDPGKVSPLKAHLPRVLSSPHMAYIKVAEGCSRHCTYCIIPTLRGPYRSRPADDIIKEAESLVRSGINELLLVAESTTDYGMDLDVPEGLETVLSRMADISEETSIRLMYAFPDTLTDAVIDTIGARKNICSYFDIPIQHASDSILKKMGRNYTEKDLKELFKKIRKTIPDAALRTTVITGFPGETDEDFDTLIRFVKEVKFDHLGVFTYSDSDDLPSSKLPNHVTEDIAQERHDRLMALQAGISLENNLEHVNGIYRVLIEENPDEGVYLGRTFFQAPEVDGVTFVYTNDLEVGSFVDVVITDAYEYDLAGEAT